MPKGQQLHRRQLMPMAFGGDFILAGWPSRYRPMRRVLQAPAVITMLTSTQEEEQAVVQRDRSWMP